MKKLLTYLLPILCSSYGYAQTYSTKTPMPHKRIMAVSASIGTKVYVIGGQTTGGSVINLVDEYDAVTDSWTAKANFPQPVIQSFACSYNNKVYVIGGCTGQNAFPNVWEYDPQLNTWTAKAPMPTTRCEISAAMINGKIYVTSGWYNSFKTLEIYDIATNTWSTGPNAPIGLMQINSGTEFNGSFYAIGGKNYGNTMWYDSVMVFNPSSSTWTLGPSLPSGRYAGTAVSYNTRLHYFGGGTSLFTTSYDSHYLLAANASAWQTGLPMPVKLYSPTSVSVKSGEINKVYIFGGRDEFGVIQDITLEYSEPVLGISNGDVAKLPFRISQSSSSQELWIQSDAPGEFQVRLFNTSGSLVREQTSYKDNARINTQSLAEGLYVIKITVSGANYFHKIIL